MDKAFEAEEVKVFGEMYKKGYIYKGFKPVYCAPTTRPLWQRRRSSTRTTPAPPCM